MAGARADVGGRSGCAMTKVTVAPTTRTIKGLSSGIPVGPDNGLDHECPVSLDNVLDVALHGQRQYARHAAEPDVHWVVS